MQDLTAHHLPGKLNVEADFLSRPDLQGQPPGKLQDLSIRHLNEASVVEKNPAAECGLQLHVMDMVLA